MFLAVNIGHFRNGKKNGSQKMEVTFYNAIKKTDSNFHE